MQVCELVVVAMGGFAPSLPLNFISPADLLMAGKLKAHKSNRNGFRMEKVGRP